MHGSLNVPIEHHPTIRYMVYNGYYKVMSNIPKMGQLPTPEMESMSASSLEMQTSCLSQAIAAYFEASLLRCNLAKFLLDVLGFRKSAAGQPSLPYGKKHSIEYRTCSSLL